MAPSNMKLKKKILQELSNTTHWRECGCRDKEVAKHYTIKYILVYNIEYVLFSSSDSFLLILYLLSNLKCVGILLFDWFELCPLSIFLLIYLFFWAVLFLFDFFLLPFPQLIFGYFFLEFYPFSTVHYWTFWICWDKGFHNSSICFTHPSIHLLL